MDTGWVSAGFVYSNKIPTEEEGMELNPTLVIRDRVSES